MKNVKITLQKGALPKKFYLFPSSEELYLWLCALERGEQFHVPDLDEVLLEQDGFLEVEQRGFQYFYETTDKFRRVQFVRLGKAQSPKNSAGLLVTIHSGWATSTLLPTVAHEDDSIVVTPLNPGESRINLRTLFRDDEESVQDLLPYLTSYDDDKNR